MRPVFFVQNNYVERLTAPVAIYAREHCIALEDRSSHASFDPDNCDIEWGRYDLVLPYGSVQFLRCCRASSLRPFILYDEAKFATSVWSAVFGHNALNSAGRVATAGEVGAILTQTGCQHLRPDSVDKAFVGGVFNHDQWAAMVTDQNLDADIACWVSPLRDIEAEWRCWIVGGKVIEISKYRQAGKMLIERETSQEVISAAQALANRYLPAACVVLDVAMTDSGYSLIEFNPIHSSGWYAANVSMVLSAWLEWSLCLKNLTGIERT